MRIDRMLSIVVILLNQRRITAKELSRRFEVSLRTIYRDIESINIAGIPVVSNQGAGGGYEIPDHYKLSKQYLSRSDFISIVTALKGLNTAIEDHRVEMIMEKVENLLSKQDIERSDGIDEIIVFDTAGWGNTDQTGRKIQNIYDAIQKKQLVKIAYIDSHGIASDRLIEPMTIVQKGFSWYLWAFCRSRQNMRLFKFSRMKQITVLFDCFQRKNKRYQPGRNQWVQKGEVLEITLKFSKSVRYMVEEYHQDFELLNEAQDHFSIKLTLPESPWLIGMILSYGPMVEVISPPSLRADIQNKISHLSRVYKKL